MKIEVQLGRGGLAMATLHKGGKLHAVCSLNADVDGQWSCNGATDKESEIIHSMLSLALEIALGENNGN